MKPIIYGELPSTPVVYAASDSQYFLDHGGPFVYSAAEEGYDVHIHIANPTKKVLSYAAIISSTVEVRVTYSFNDIDLSKFDKDQKRAYYAALRFFMMPNILRTAKKVLALDIDCLIMKKFEFPAKPVGYFPREPLEGTVGWEMEGTKVAAGSVYLDDSALNVADAIAKTLSGIPLRWFSDQVALTHIFNQLPKDVCHHFDSKFMDWEFEEGTNIWTGKGSRKYDNEVYLNEKRKYDKFVDVDFLDHTKTVVLSPRLDLSFKRGQIEIAKTNIDPIRDHWANFVSKIANESEDTLIITAPRWFFNSTMCDDYFYSQPLYVPHEEKKIWGGSNNCLFYMQTVFPWLFTIDSLGYGGGSSYKNSFISGDRYNEKAFNSLKSYVEEGGSKFKHLQGEDEWGRHSSNSEPYILVPIQLPHDYVIKHHSTITMEEMVSKLCLWADNSGMKVVFKGHPVNLSSMKPLIEIINNHNNVEYHEEVDINPMIKDAYAVYVINSGAGQEAMLQDSRVVVFGDCDYQRAVINGNINDLEGTLEDVRSDDFEERKKIYRKWFHWFVEMATYDSRISLHSNYIK